MDNPLHKEPVDEAEMNGVNVDIQKVLILSAFLHDIGNGGKYYDKPEHEGILI